MPGKECKRYGAGQPDIMEQAEDIPDRFGLPVSVVINTLYRRIIMRNGLPFSMTVPTQVPARDSMSTAEFGAMMTHEPAQAKADDSIPPGTAMACLMRGL